MRSRSDSQGVSPGFAAAYDAQRASAGLIISEATNVSAQARGYEYTPRIRTGAQVAAWRALETVRSGRADLVSFGRPFLSNPDLVERIRRRGPFAEQAPRETWYGGGRKGYIGWPTLAA
ncbi:oxidoreductase [Rhodopila globiformis]|uniref:oxidoreductase n=1 Tax=Rhodopila globiformis TaxID=1071 RepID=UPI0023B1D919|nr:hypothetical protein [Rhodopila globiformis]